MISEQEIYGTQGSLFYDKVSLIPELHTYHCSPDYGRDVNTDNLEQYLKNPIFGQNTYTQEEKYPLCVCMTPKSRIVALGENFYFNIFFIRKSQVSSIDSETNQSEINIYKDWSDMKKVALVFLGLIKTAIYKETYTPENVLYRSFMSFGQDMIDIRRLSNFTVDNVSGVSINFTLVLNTAIC